MSVTENIRCPSCQALVNPAWLHCAVCQHPLREQKTDWLAAWRELAAITYGIEKEDPRFERVMMWLNVADEAFKIDSWIAFQEAAAEVKRIAKRNVG
jgi:hypothetical protein